ncbi:hydroxylase [Nocardioides sp. Kera G14]|uniref:hydroxylase n=1 Tax=Nocardioides sp. Kera G14 TaxID=2884264 RepID=UPI001D111FFD|nr:hydroxylase [Nocardioides sp. Kera G14]UDY24589.1 hydroxylase [Nocardioides sp. Kera G14]
MSNVLQRIEEQADFFSDQAEEADALGRLPDTTAKMMRELGVVKILHPADFGGLEGSPIDFYKAIMAIGSRSASAGWVASVVGIHAYQMAQADRRLQEEIWGKDGAASDTWVASPYAPFGKATPVEGGWLFSGRWPFSSGTDHCDWVVLGGLLLGEDGKPVAGDPVRHFVLPRADYEIVPDSWNVVGLKGTGSKDILIKDAFIPDYRMIDPNALSDFELARKAGRDDSPTYRMPFHTMFSGTITAGTLGAALGVLREARAYMKSRVTVKGVATNSDPRHLFVLSEAAADIDASVMQFLSSIEEMWGYANRREEIPMDLRVRARRDQVRSAHRAVEAADKLVKMAGGNALRLDSAIQRAWRDAHMALGHQVNQEDVVYQAWGLHDMGLPVPASARV